ncbi:MAG TPA: glycoside hydrolase family 27 protein [Methylomirabilota bacterium]|nr:glycoside hydrolase family 27 protein [Methylomirabilota bacterium]
MRSRLMVCGVVFAALLLCALAKTGAAANNPPILAATPPMGWNSWDGYGTTITEDQVKATADAFAKNLKPFGWQYVVVDAEWFVTNPTAEGNSKSSQYSMDAYGRYTPAANRFPSSVPGAGFKPLADYLHSLGLKFGIHILRGIPKKAVEANLPIANSSYHASDAADTGDTCPWNPDNYGIDASKPGGQAYYDSIAALYASWGIDFLKVDCISSHPYRGDEIRMLSAAIAKTGRPIVLSLSPGPAPIEKYFELREYAQMWRISNDIWDLWHSTSDYPQGVGDQFATAAKWAGLAQPGHWPDADMLPLGELGPAPGWGAPRTTRLTHDEQRTLITLWSIFHSPLIVGGDLTKMDDWTLSLLTNPEVLAVDQHAWDSRVPFDDGKITAWTADSGVAYYIAVFNRTDTAQDVDLTWQDLKLTWRGRNRPHSNAMVRDLWQHDDIGPAVGLRLRLPAHGCALYEVRAQK